MDHKQLTQALHKLECEYGVTFEGTTLIDDRWYQWRCQCGPTETIFVDVLDGMLSANIKKLGAQYCPSGSLPPACWDTVLIWLDAKLREFSRDTRAATLDMLLDQLLLGGSGSCCRRAPRHPHARGWR